MLQELELFPSKGRPKFYDFSTFLHSNTTHIRIPCTPTVGIYNSIKSSFYRWRKNNGVEKGFVFDIYPNEIVIWRRQRK
jgi:hypothetical protein